MTDAARSPSHEVREPSAGVASGAASPPSFEQRLRAALRTTRPGEAALAALVFLVVVAFFPPAFAPRWTPRAVLYLGVLPAALVGLVRLVARRDKPAILAVAFLGAATLSAAVSEAPFRSLLPVYYRHESVAAWASALGVWALVRLRSESGRTLIERAFVSAVVASVVVGVLQLASDVRSGPLALVGNRASGLSLNPVYLGALAAGALAWGARRRIDSGDAGRSVWISVGITASTLGIWISGSRIALLVALVVLAGALVQSTRLTVRAVVPWVALGVVLGEIAQWSNRTLSGGASALATERLGGASVASGFGVRFEMWRFDLSAFARRPLLGHGPGSHANAVQPHLTADFVERTNPDDLLNNWTDAHNIVLELLVVVGIVGLVLAIGFAVSQVGAVRGPAAWAALAIGTTWLLQPSGFVTLLPMLALLGAAGDGVADRRRPGSADGPGVASTVRSGRTISAIAVGLGVALAGWLVVADAALLRADADRNIANGERAASWWWHDPMSAREAAVLGLREAVVGEEPSDREAVLDLARAMTDRDPELAFWWVQRGDIERIFDLDDDARRSYRRALDTQPWSRAAIESLIALERDPDEVVELTERLARLDATDDVSP